MQIYQQRAERENLERLISRASFDSPVEPSERYEIRELWRTAQRTPANTLLPSDGSVRLITSGWAGWARYTGQSKNPIFLFLMPGDFIIPGLYDAGCCQLVALTPICCVDAASLRGNATGLTPRAASMINQSGLYYRGLLIDHMTRLATGSTLQAVAHLLHEFYVRSTRAGACAGGRFHLPIGQRVLGRSLGRSSVQINKVVRRLQGSRVLSIGYDWVDVLDPEGLEQFSGFPHTTELATRTSERERIILGSWPAGSHMNGHRNVDLDA